MSYIPQYTKPYADGYVNRPSKTTPEKAEYINARDDALIRIENYLATLNFDGKYALLTEAGYSLELSIDEYYVLTISLKNKAGTVISSKQIDFPIESMIINVDYNEDTGIITFNLQNGQSLEVNISTLVRGLVADTRTIAGIDLKDDITAEELKDALGMYDEGLTAGTLKPFLHNTEEVLCSVFRGKPLYEKIIDFGTLPNATSRVIEHGIENVETIWIHDGYCLNSNNGLSIPIVGTTPSSVEANFYFAVSPTIINCETGTDRTHYTAYLILRYTKTTDAEGSGNNLNPYGIYDAKLDDVEANIESVSAEVDAVNNSLIATDATVINYNADNKEEALAYLNNPTTIPFIGARTRCYNFLFADSAGDSPFGGGYVRISGYTYANNKYGFQMAFRFGQRPKWRSNNNGVWSEWEGVGTLAEVTALQNRLAYKEIAGFINPGDTGCTASAYTENGLVHVYLTVPQGASGLLSVTINSASYYPRSPVGGVFASLTSGQDIGKLVGYALKDGKINIYATSAMEATEALTFVYPLKSS